MTDTDNSFVGNKLADVLPVIGHWNGGGSPDPLVVEFYLGVTKCPPRAAAASNFLSNRGQCAWPEITFWPKAHQFALDDGTGNIHPVIRVRGMRMWNQEIAVFLTQRKKSIGAMIEELGLSSFLPRPKTVSEYEVSPQPEDFKLFGYWQCCRCEFKWAMRKGEPAREFCPHCYCGWWQSRKSKEAVAE